LIPIPEFSNNAQSTLTPRGLALPCRLMGH
jgi:hypothetical protein